MIYTLIVGDNIIINVINNIGKILLRMVIEVTNVCALVASSSSDHLINVVAKSCAMSTQQEAQYIGVEES